MGLMLRDQEGKPEANSQHLERSAGETVGMPRSAMYFLYIYFTYQSTLLE